MNNISKYMKHMYDTKLIAMRDGNISFKPASKNYFYITPGSVRKNNLVEEDLVRVTFTSDFESKKSLHISNHILNLKPSREINMHAIFHTKKERVMFIKDLFFSILYFFSNSISPSLVIISNNGKIKPIPKISRKLAINKKKINRIDFLFSNEVNKLIPFM